MTLSLIDWVAAGTITLAVVGVFSFAATVVLAYFTQRAAEATARDAESSSEMIREVRRDRELGVKPHIVITRITFVVETA